MIFLWNAIWQSCMGNNTDDSKACKSMQPYWVQIMTLWEHFMWKFVKLLHHFWLLYCWRNDDATRRESGKIKNYVFCLQQCFTQNIFRYKYVPTLHTQHTWKVKNDAEDNGAHTTCKYGKKWSECVHAHMCVCVCVCVSHTKVNWGEIQLTCWTSLLFPQVIQTVLIATHFGASGIESVYKSGFRNGNMPCIRYKWKEILS